MPRDNWSESETYLLQLLVKQGLTPQGICDEFSQRGIKRTYQAIRRKIQRERRREPTDWYAQVRTSEVTPYANPLHVEGDALCLFDLQVPFHDAAWINRCIALALGWGVENVILGGDLVDLAAFSPFGRTVEVEAEDEIRATEQVLTALSSSFSRVYWFAGNHEARLAIQLGKQVKLERALNMFSRADNVQVSDFRWCELSCAGADFYIEHPGSFSKRPTSVAVELCAIHDRSVIAGHGHLWGMTRDASNRHWAIDSGMCADPERLEYNVKVHKRFPKMVQGAVIVRESIPYLLCPANISGFERFFNVS